MKNTKGITLIALVVTIIVLLILAGVAINLVAGGDGIMAKAQNAINLTNEAEAKERVNLKIAEFKTDFYNAVYVEKRVSVNVKFGDWVAQEYAGEVIKAGAYEFTISGAAEPYTITILENNRLQNDIIGTMAADGKATWADESVAKQAKTAADARTVVVKKVLSYQDDFYEEVFVDQTTSTNAEFGDWVAENYGDQAIEAEDYVFEITGESAPYAITVMENPGEVQTFRMTRNASTTQIEGQMSEKGKITWDAVGNTVVEVTSNAQDAVVQANADYKMEYYKAVYVDQTVSQAEGFGDWLADNYGGQELQADDYTYQISGEVSPYDVKLNKSGNLTKSSNGEMDSAGDITWKTSSSGGSEGGTENPGTEEPTPDEPEPATKYTVSYDANGGEGSVPEETEYEEGATVEVEFSVNLAKDGYVFAGWATTSDATEATYASAGTTSFSMGTEDVILYAVFEEYQLYQSKHPELHIPTGFQWKTGTAATGYVITDAANPSDDNGNEFVWIPVASSSAYAKKIGTYNYSLATAGKDEDASAFNGDIALAIKGDVLGVNEILDEEVTVTIDANLPEAAIVNNAGGFWVGRYEAGVANAAHGFIADVEVWTSTATEINAANDYWEERKDDVIVKQNAEPVRNITQAKALSIANGWKSGKAGDGTVAFQSGLITGAQWDTMCNFIGWDIADGNCSDWGNYTNTASSAYSGYHSTGGSSDWLSENSVVKEEATDTDGNGVLESYNKWIFPTGKFVTSNNGSTDKKNIYDIAGNVFEWSTERPQALEDYGVLRGGSANFTGDHDNATFRHGGRGSTNLVSWNIGFRMVLYVE